MKGKERRGEGRLESSSVRALARLSLLITSVSMPTSVSVISRQLFFISHSEVLQSGPLECFWPDPPPPSDGDTGMKK